MALIEIRRTEPGHPEFQALVMQLDKELSINNGEENAFYAQFNKTDSIRHAILAYADNQPVGCGAIKQYDTSTMEVKRMFVISAFRGLGVGSKVLAELEKWSEQLGFERCVLETGTKQLAAIQLYQKHAYREIPNYGQYAGKSGSICFEKRLVSP